MIERVAIRSCVAAIALAFSGSVLGQQQQVTMERLNPVGQQCELAQGSSLPFRARFRIGSGLVGYIKWSKADWYVDDQFRYKDDLSGQGFAQSVESTFVYEGQHPGTESVSVIVQYLVIGVPRSSSPLMWTVTVLRNEALMLSSTVGGAVTVPGEGRFKYTHGTDITIVATPDDGYRFTHWTGSISSTSNPLVLTMDKAYDLTANFTLEFTALYVDDDARDVQDGSFAHPFGSINEAIANANDGFIVVVLPGTYLESIDLMGKDLKVTSLDPNYPVKFGFPVVDGNGAGPVTANVGQTSELEGLILTGGVSETGSAIRCVGTHPTIRNCLVVGNLAIGLNGAALYFEDSNAVLVNCTVADNRGGEQGCGIRALDSELRMVNCILWNNLPVEILADGKDVSVQYSCVAGGWSGIGNFGDDPLFALPGAWTAGVWMAGDYHLLSTAGRWDVISSQWVVDSAYSPCIDAGDPSFSVALERKPHGARVNVGAYGATDQGSMSNVRADPADMVFASIPAGTFAMGDHFGVGFPQEKPIHTVTLDGFEISVYETTNAQYAEYLNSALADGLIQVVNGVVYAAPDSSQSQPYCDMVSKSTLSQIEYSEGRFTVRSRDGYSMSDQPVVQVSWYGAHAFCGYYGYRLPTEAEWEYAARGGYHDPYYRYPWGSNDIDCRFANYLYQPYDDYCNPLGLTAFPYTSPAGYYGPQGSYRLCDMSGNVWEWCQDWYGSDYYEVSPANNPPGPLEGTQRVMRGGCWGNNDKGCRVANRPSGVNPGARNGCWGFRVCRSIPSLD